MARSVWSESSELALETFSAPFQLFLLGQVPTELVVLLARDGWVESAAREADGLCSPGGYLGT